MPPRLVVLLPPSEGKAPGGDGPGWAPDDGRFPALGPARAEVVGALGAAMVAADARHERLLGVGGAHLGRAVAANRALVGAPTLPAARRFTGVVWDHLDLDGLPSPARRRASASVIVLSGLLGAVAVDDPVPDHRLKMGASLAPLGRLSRWWQPRLAAALGRRLAGAVVVDLLPEEHAAALPRGTTPSRRWLRVRFEEHGPVGPRRAVGHDAKAAKGLLARHLLLAGGDPSYALALAAEAVPGWRLDPSAGDDGTVVLVRRPPGRATRERAAPRCG